MELLISQMSFNLNRKMGMDKEKLCVLYVYKLIKFYINTRKSKKKKILTLVGT